MDKHVHRGASLLKNFNNNFHFMTSTKVERNTGRVLNYVQISSATIGHNTRDKDSRYVKWNARSEKFLSFYELYVLG